MPGRATLCDWVIQLTVCESTNRVDSACVSVVQSVPAGIESKCRPKGDVPEVWHSGTLSGFNQPAQGGPLRNQHWLSKPMLAGLIGCVILGVVVAAVAAIMAAP